MIVQYHAPLDSQAQYNSTCNITLAAMYRSLRQIQIHSTTAAGAEEVLGVGAWLEAALLRPHLTVTRTPSTSRPFAQA